MHESHIIIQHRVVLENLDALRSKFLEISNGSAIPLNTLGRPSAAWGQPLVDQVPRVEIPREKGSSKRGACRLYHDVIESAGLGFERFH